MILSRSISNRHTMNQLYPIRTRKFLSFLLFLGLFFSFLYATFPVHTQGPTVYSVSLRSRQDNGASANIGFIILNGTFYTLPTVQNLNKGRYEAKYVPPDPNYAFIRWMTSGSVSVSDPNAQTTTLIVDGKGELCAVYSFQPKIYTLTVCLKDGENNPTQNVSVKIDDNPFITDSQGKVSMKVVLGCHVVDVQRERYFYPSNDTRDLFERWTFGSTSGLDNPRTIYVNTSSSYTAYYVRQYRWRLTTSGLPDNTHYKLTFQGTAYGFISPTTRDEWVNRNGRYTFRASLAVTPFTGLAWSNTTYVFSHWENETGHTISSSYETSQTVFKPETFIAGYDSTQMHTRNLAVHVQSIASVPIESANVKVYYYGTQVASGLTDASGNVVFRLPPNPEYKITAKKGWRSGSKTIELYVDSTLTITIWVGG